MNEEERAWCAKSFLPLITSCINGETVDVESELTSLLESFRTEFNKVNAEDLKNDFEMMVSEWCESEESIPDAVSKLLDIYHEWHLELSR